MVAKQAAADAAATSMEDCGLALFIVLLQWTTGTPRAFNEISSGTEPGATTTTPTCTGTACV
eukprot:CAMPEP_0178704470 /NCGR_PEP_ID=MMETSP0699-20121125/14202_1 /TAXON_ID=265572 /ORGANISM="Extubocellulus spinifer, Strain CCMP396" /LENGTH=61 /DNA_ID=CAMNT_0020351829 /DNA_START=204 /DNA_END=389 /DNA_ORIENTATION=+